MMNVVLVDAGGANIGSVQYALQRLGVTAVVTADPMLICAASHVILPGVGAAAQGMQRLRENRLDTLIPTLSQPVLGVCLGMQLLFDASEEGHVPCLGVMSGKVKKMTKNKNIRIPHMGWNALEKKSRDPLLANVDDHAMAYFVHSYAAPVGAYTLATSFHGDTLSAIVRKRNFYGIQCHPERSARVGAQLLENFLNL